MTAAVTAGARGRRLRAAVLVCVLAAGALVASTVDLPSAATVRAVLEGPGVLGGAAMALVLGVVLLAPVPRSAVSVLVGLAAGFWVGLGIAYAGALLAALAAFALGRGLGRDAVRHLAGPRLSRFDDAVTTRGFFAVLTGRLAPVLPFVVVSYGAGLTGVRFRSYALATVLGLVPSTVVQVGIGASARLVVGAATPAVVAAAVVVLIAVVIGIALWRRGRAVAPT